MTAVLEERPRRDIRKAAPARSGVSPQLLDVIRAEFREMPGMRLTRSQFRRLWQLDQTVCENAICHLREEGFLDVDDEGQLRCVIDVRV
jgi:hypothetical protein